MDRVADSTELLKMGCGFSSPETAPQVGPRPLQQAQAVPQADSQPAPQAAPTTGTDPVSQAFGDAQQVVGLIDGVYKLVQPALLRALNRRDETNSLKKFLGPWWGEAFEHGLCMVPVLDIKNFEQHLQRTNGVLQPQGNCTAISPWGYLLHALAINPGDGILTWKPAGGARWDMLEGSIALDVRGTAFCHLVNLYKTQEPYDEGMTIKGELQECGKCRLVFGWLTWTSTDAGHMNAKFEPDTVPKLNSLKEPLGSLYAALRNLRWELYQAALRDGVSEGSMVWPNANNTSLSERMQCLIIYFGKVTGALVVGNRALVVTRAWVEHASRIKRRVMTDGGKDESFLKDAYKTLAQHPLRPRLSESEYKTSHLRLRGCFFFDDDHFTLHQNDPELSIPWFMRSDIETQEILKATIQTYKDEPLDSWKGQLFASQDNVLKIATMDKNVPFWEGSVRVLDFAPRDPLWSARVHL